MDTPSSFSDNMTIDRSGNIYIIVHHPATPKHMQGAVGSPPSPHNASLHWDRGFYMTKKSMNETMYQGFRSIFFKNKTSKLAVIHTSPNLW